MEGLKVLMMAIIAVFGLFATIFGLVAEASRKTIFYVSCEEIRNPVVGLGISGALLLLLAMVVANVCGGCICCCTYGKNLEPSKKTPAVACLSISWLIFAVAFVLLLEGTSHGTPAGEGKCIIVRPGIMGGGGVLSFLCTLFAIGYYLLATSTPVAFGTPTQGSIPMGTPAHKMEFQTGPQAGPQAVGPYGYA